MGGKRKLEIKLVGAKSRYEPIYANQAYKLALLGYTDADFAKFFEVSITCLEEWYRLFPEFKEAVQEGRDKADANVAQSLYRRATGMKIPRVKIFNDFGIPLVVPYIEYIPPDVAACIIWLKNRRPQDWRESRFNKPQIDGSDTENVVIFQLPDNGRNDGPESDTPPARLSDESIE